ncbi:hypothetical protein FRAHR75_30092 [Frankia sp. Hr75.2]|nr:hypothetical protein FRAHR75_30092 [Frankia sp. Hr75.2]
MPARPARAAAPTPGASRRAPPAGRPGRTGRPGGLDVVRDCAGSRHGPGIGSAGAAARGNGHDGHGPVGPGTRRWHRGGRGADENRVAAHDTGTFRAVGAVAVLARRLLELLLSRASRAVADVIVGAHQDLVHSRITPRARLRRSRGSCVVRVVSACGRVWREPDRGAAPRGPRQRAVQPPSAGRSGG